MNVKLNKNVDYVKVCYKAMWKSLKFYLHALHKPLFSSPQSLEFRLYSSVQTSRWPRYIQRSFSYDEILFLFSFPHIIYIITSRSSARMSWSVHCIYWDWNWSLMPYYNNNQQPELASYIVSQLSECSDIFTHIKSGFVRKQFRL